MSDNIKHLGPGGRMSPGEQLYYADNVYDNVVRALVDYRAEVAEVLALAKNARQENLALISDITSELTGPDDQYLRDRLLARASKVEDSLRKAPL